MAEPTPSTRLFRLIGSPYRKCYSGLDLADIAYAMANVEVELAKTKKRLRAYKKALIQSEAGRHITPAHLLMWAKKMLDDEDCDSLLLAWLLGVAGEWDRLLREEAVVQDQARPPEEGHEEREATPAEGAPQAGALPAGL